MHVNGERSTLTNIDDLYLTIIILLHKKIRKALPAYSIYTFNRSKGKQS